MSHRRVRVCLVALLAMAGSVTAAGEAAAAPPGPRSKAVCSVVGHLALDPGLPYAGPVEYTSVDELPADPGHLPLVCTGRVNGHDVVPVADPVVAGQVGSYTEWGWTEGDCRSGDGHGWYAAWVNTTAGVQYLTGDYQLHYDGLAGDGYEVGDTIIAEFTFRPTAGSCQPGDPLLGFLLDQDEVLYSAL
jgi:hypothetical protein